MGQEISSTVKFWTHNQDYWGQSYKIDADKIPKKLEDAPEEPLLIAESSSSLHAIASSALTQCATANQKFLDCKSKSSNPENCIKEAIDVRRCSFDL